MTTINVTVYDDEGDEIALALPACYEVCWVCMGEGQIPDRALSPTGDGSWTESERWEFFDGDPDFAEEYFAGGYQQACPECDGKRVVSVVDRERADAADLKLYDEHMQAEADYAQLCKMERMYGC